MLDTKVPILSKTALGQMSTWIGVHLGTLVAAGSDINVS